MSQPQEQPSRYTRSFGGLVGALLVTVLFVAAYVGFRALGREQPGGGPEAVSYLQPVRDLQEAGVPVVYPRDLPRGWVSTSVTYQRGAHPQWTVGMVTAHGDFVGVTQQAAPLADLLTTFVDDHPVQGKAATVPSVLGDSWGTWSDAGGDHALSTEVSSGPLTGQQVLVYGSAPLVDQEHLVEQLTTDDLPARASASASSS